MDCRDIAALSPLYLARELDAPRAAEFAAHLETCPACSREVEQGAHVDSQLRQGLFAERIDSGALDQRIRKRIAADSAARRFRSVRWLVAASAAAVLLAAVGYRVFAATPQVCADAALDHRLEVTGQQYRPWVFDRAAIESLAERQGVPAPVVAALGNAGYRLERGKVCRLAGQAFLHLVYSDGSREFSVFLRRREAGRMWDRTLDGAAVDQQYVTSLRTDRLTGIVVTGQSREAALRLGQDVARIL